MSVGLLSRNSATNPYQANELDSVASHASGTKWQERILVLAVVVALGAANTIAALIDTFREGLPTIDGYLFVGIASLIPFAMGVTGMLPLFTRRSPSYWIWSAGTIVAILPGLIVWLLYSLIPSPRVHNGAGQMHIFFLPIIHILYCIVPYLGAGFLALVVVPEDLSIEKQISQSLPVHANELDEDSQIE